MMKSLNPSAPKRSTISARTEWSAQGSIPSGHTSSDRRKVRGSRPSSSQLVSRMRDLSARMVRELSISPWVAQFQVSAQRSATLKARAPLAATTSGGRWCLYTSRRDMRFVVAAELSSEGSRVAAA